MSDRRAPVAPVLLALLLGATGCGTQGGRTEILPADAIVASGSYVCVNRETRAPAGVTIDLAASTYRTTGLEGQGRYSYDYSHRQINFEGLLSSSPAIYRPPRLVIDLKVPERTEKLDCERSHAAPTA